MQQRILDKLTEAGIAITEEETGKLATYLELMLRWNEVHNLTSVTNQDEMIDRHLVESLACAPYLRGDRVADVGSGAGLPGIPLAIARPEIEFTLIESRGKRARFLEHVRGALDLDNVIVEHARAEDLSPERPFATVLARAVAAPSELIELTQQLRAEAGILLILTRANYEEELPAEGFSAHIADDPVTRSLKGALVIIEAKRN
ncbi:MAG: 16S rRNA (guanine(527)-N(7))-methyltransferase RsmG [Gammaproteobacteria bacterium]